MFSTTLRRSFLARSCIVQTPRQLVAARPFHQSTAVQARKDAQDKDSLKPEGNEYSKSGSDDDSARIEETAFSADKTRPEEQEAHAEKEAGAQGEKDNPLNVSPANQEVSKPRAEAEGGPEGSAAESGQGSERERASGGGSSPKSGGGKYGGGGGAGGG